jgi:hypothetical protein
MLNSACSANNRELQSILRYIYFPKYSFYLIPPCREVRFLTNRLKVKDEQDEIVSDWKFAAMVIDR